MAVRSSKSEGVWLDDSIDTIVNNVAAFIEHINYKTMRMLGIIAVDLLSKTQPKVPYETTELRASGTASVHTDRDTFIVGTGILKTTDVRADLGKLTNAAARNVKKHIDMTVMYFKMRDDFDVAVFTHEFINPHGYGMSPEARMAGTGPNYLRSTWEENKKKYISMIRDTYSEKKLGRDVALLYKAKQKRAGRYLVSGMTVKRSRIGLD